MKNIHVIPTEKPSRLCYVICTEKSTLTLFEDEMEKGKRFFPQNIYITSDEEIKEGDWFYEPINNCILKYDSKSNKLIKAIFSGLCKKIILTTDQDLIADNVQAIDDAFLEYFVKNPSCEFVKVEKNEFYSKKAFIEGKNAMTYEYKTIIQKQKSKQEILNEAAKKYMSTIDFGTIEIFDSFIAGVRWAEQKIIIPKEEVLLQSSIDGEPIWGEEPKQETLEEVAEKESEYLADWEDKKMYQKGFIDGAKWQQEQGKNKYSEEEVLKILYDYRNHFELYRNIQVLPDMFFSWFEQFKNK